MLHGAESGCGGSENDFGQSNIGGNESGETFMEGEREQLEEKESIGVKIYFGLRAQGNYNLTKRYNNNEVLKALYAEAGWTDEEDETTYCKVLFFFRLSTCSVLMEISFFLFVAILQYSIQIYHNASLISSIYSFPFPYLLSPK